MASSTISNSLLASRRNGIPSCLSWCHFGPNHVRILGIDLRHRSNNQQHRQCCLRHWRQRHFPPSSIVTWPLATNLCRSRHLLLLQPQRRSMLLPPPKTITATTTAAAAKMATTATKASCPAAIPLRLMGGVPPSAAVRQQRRHAAANRFPVCAIHSAERCGGGTTVRQR